MIAILLLLLTWLGAGVALGSASAGLTVAAGIVLWWSVGTSIITALLGTLLIGWGTLRGGLEGFATMGLCVLGSLIFWCGLGIAAAYMVTLGGGWIILGVICWIVSILAQILSGIGLNRVYNS